MYQSLFILLFGVFVILCSSCKDDPSEVELLASSGWLGAVEYTDLDYNDDNTLIDENVHQGSEEQFLYLLLNSDKAASIKYGCDKMECNGNVYNGKWELTGSMLKVSINREEIHALADLTVVEGKLVRVNKAELIVEVFFYNPAPGIARRVRRLKYLEANL